MYSLSILCSLSFLSNKQVSAFLPVRSGGVWFFFFFLYDITQPFGTKLIVGGYSTNTFNCVSSYYSTCVEVRIYPKDIYEGQAVLVLTVPSQNESLWSPSLLPPCSFKNSPAVEKKKVKDVALCFLRKLFCFVQYFRILLLF